MYCAVTVLASLLVGRALRLGYQRSTTLAFTAGLEVQSAGTCAGTELNPLLVEVLGEVDVDISGHRPQQLTDELQQGADRVIVLGSEAAVDPAPGVNLERWELDEPSLRGIDGLERMQLVRDDLARRVAALHAELTAERA